MPLWVVDYFKLVIFKAQKAQELSTFQVVKEFKRKGLYQAVGRSSHHR